MRNRSAYVTLFICAMILVTGAWLAKAGDLNPPPGPVAGTMKPLDVVEPRTPISALPFTINQSGSYFLTCCLTGMAGQNGITISADDVTLDLNGFSLVGVPGSLDGVAVSFVAGGRKNVTVRNGTVRDWGGSGVATDGNSQLQSLLASGNNVGLSIGPGGTVASCTAIDNAFAGIILQPGCVISNSSARSNGDGIKASSGCVVTNCTATSNVGVGINASGGSGTIIACTAEGNGGDGFAIAFDCTVTNCTAIFNGGEGFDVGDDCTIRGCTATTNTGHGIRAVGDNYTIGNTCTKNGFGISSASGIQINNSDNRIEGNNVTDNDIGMDVKIPQNFIIKNTASGNTLNYDIVAGNKVGVIVAAPSSIAINGSTGGAGVGTTDPWANFSY